MPTFRENNPFVFLLFFLTLSLSLSCFGEIDPGVIILCKVLNLCEPCLPRREAGKYITATIVRDRANDDGIPRRSCKSSCKEQKTGKFLATSDILHRRRTRGNRFRYFFRCYCAILPTETNLLYKRHVASLAEKHRTQLRWINSSCPPAPMRRTKRNDTVLDRDSENSSLLSLSLSLPLCVGSCSVRSIITSSNSTSVSASLQLSFPAPSFPAVYDSIRRSDDCFDVQRYSLFQRDSHKAAASGAVSVSKRSCFPRAPFDEKKS